MGRLRTFLRSWVVAAMVGAAWPASAQTAADKNAARALADAGFEQYSAGHYDVALEKLEAAEARVHAPTHVLYIARSLVKLGRFPAAREAYARLGSEVLPKAAPKAFRDAQAEGARDLEALKRSTPRLRVVVRRTPTGEAPIVTVDGARVEATALAEGLELDPGDHAVVATAGGRSASATVHLGAGDAAREVALDLGSAGETAAPVEAPNRSVPVPLVVAFGVGGAGLITGAVTGGLSFKKVGELKDACPTNPCSSTPEHTGLRDSASALGTVSTVAFIVGGAATAVGVVLVVARARGSSERAASLRLAPGSASVEGRF